MSDLDKMFTGNINQDSEIFKQIAKKFLKIHNLTAITGMWNKDKFILYCHVKFEGSKQN